MIHFRKAKKQGRGAFLLRQKQSLKAKEAKEYKNLFSS